ncbi:SusD/RagB family nutrient-binding outer membrane lipoprotein [Chitinophaga sedimenti]|uniref:SusD/RagB family nutrient-binding outer membrane lipoprotein n=1 Tax=Chitinophaga sedimenti TaxID=2033606 RepID=UPI002005A35F|nr:SusD/RagB family nutrient-binding outer membrane lipoprotein [Chitinophaga sedimenti]MCK7560145.1 SusD/RagB family nutrient-binding outer membrane lipoprotein [Chitinophaga sedimenti]
MKILSNKKSLIVLAMSGVLALSSCGKELYTEYNTDPAILYGIKPEEQFTNACIAMFDADFEYYYDYYRIMMPRMQYQTGVAGNGKTFMSEVGNFNQRRNYFYSRTGNVLSDISYLASLQSDPTKYKNEIAIADILKVYYAFYTTEINGSLPYKEAFQARYNGTLTPKYDKQEELFNTFDESLKADIAQLKSGDATQVNFGTADLYYKGVEASWVKAANALRIRIAMRLLKRNPEKLKTIATEVFANETDLFASNADNPEFVTSFQHTGVGSNWDPTGNGGIWHASKAVADLMYETNDPRMRMIFQKNGYSQANINLGIAQGKLPAGTVENPRRYFGSFASPDAAVATGNVRWYTRPQITKNGGNYLMDTLSQIQYRLFCPGLTNPEVANGTPGTGAVTFPMLTYSELNFHRAELIARGILTTGSAETYYKLGVVNSVLYYSTVAGRAAVYDYVAADETEANNYYENNPKVKYNAAKALDQIASQEYLHYFKQANEGWSLYKRTGMPNATTTLAFERVYADGVEQQMPRRALIATPAITDRNFTNAQGAIDAMAQDPDFGQGPSDIFGRVWWDKK